MNNKTFTKTYASTTAPDPQMHAYWTDLTADPYGSVVKYWNGITYANLNTTGQDASAPEINPDGGQNNYAPIANPEFTGTATINGDVISTTDLNGTNYVMVYGAGTPEKNAAELQAAYDAAKLMLPTADNVITVVVAPGEYNFGDTAFVVDTPGINIVSLTGNSDVIIRSTENYSANSTIYGIKVTANDILIKGINCKTNAFYIADNLDNLICNNCTGGRNSFGSGNTVSGTFNNCIGGIRSFGGNAGTVSGTFNNCTGGDYSFGYVGIVSGAFNHCIGGSQSFGCAGTIQASATFNYCTGGDYSFSGDDVSGTFNHCIGGNQSFGKSGSTVSGTFNHCIGGVFSFGSVGTIQASARLYYTRLTSGTFTTPVAGGRLILCIDGNNNIVTI